MNISQEITGTQEPITVEDARAWLRVDYTTDDALIESLITVARESAEEFCNRAFIDKTVTLTTTDFSDPIILPYPEHESIESVKIDGIATTYTKTGSTQFTVEINNITTDDGDTLDGYECEIVYKCVANVTEKVKHAIRILIKDLYDNRSEVKMSENVYAFLLPLKVYQ